MQGLVISIIGFGMVFLILVLLIAIIKIMQLIFEGMDKRAAVPAAPAPVPAAPAPVPAAEVPEADADIDIAVISAAVAAYLGTEKSDRRFVVRSVRRIDPAGSAWSRSGKSY